MTPELSPYYYPTSIALVDDNQPFLDTLSLYLSQFFDCKTFVDPADALRFTNQNVTTKDVNNPFFSLEKEYKNKDFFQHIQNKQKDKNRSQELSVVVVDYDMPTLNGVEFCSRIKDSSVRKVLLTGRATHKQVVSAFNDNIIDYYIEKQDDCLLDSVRDIVREMQKSYFAHRLQAMTLSLVKSGSPFFVDSALADFFDDVCQRLNVFEYFYLGKPSRFVLHTKAGQKLLLIYTEAELKEHVQIIKDEHGPKEWMVYLDSRQYVPYFSSSDGFYDPDMPPKDNPMHLATVIEGQRNYYCAVIDSNEKNISPSPIFQTPKNILH